MYLLITCLLTYTIVSHLPLVLWHCWFGVSKSIQPAKTSDEALMWLSADCLQVVQLMPLHPKLHHLLTHLNPDFLVQAYPHCPGKEAVKRV